MAMWKRITNLERNGKDLSRLEQYERVVSCIEEQVGWLQGSACVSSTATGNGTNWRHSGGKEVTIGGEGESSSIEGA